MDKMTQGQLEASWFLDYDMRTDQCYQRPGCPECNAPFGLEKDGKYHCFSCGEEITVTDDEMLKWLADRAETKVEMRDDPVIFSKNGKPFGCGGKGCVETHYIRNKVTLEWNVAWGMCRACGGRFIV